jgi:hypothetical protein
MAVFAFVVRVAVVSSTGGPAAEADPGAVEGRQGRGGEDAPPVVAMPPLGWLAFQAAMASRLEGGVAPGATMLDPLGVSNLPFPMSMMMRMKKKGKGLRSLESGLIFTFGSRTQDAFLKRRRRKGKEW